MTTYPVAELLRRWGKGELTAEQMIGYLLQNLLAVMQQFYATWVKAPI